MKQLNIALPARGLALILAGISLVLSIHSIAGDALEWHLGTKSTYFIYQWVEVFNVNRESSIPTWYSSGLLLFCATLLAVIALAVRQNKDRSQRHWFGLSLIFLYLSFDEAAAIHETLTTPLQESLSSGGYFYFAWVFVGIVFVGVVGILYLKFLWSLPNRTRLLFVLAGLVYIGGALGVEVISANQWYINDGISLKYSAIATVEETFEMLGATLFIYALIRYLSEYVGELTIRFTMQKAVEESPNQNGMDQATHPVESITAGSS
jgi:hypothetical protein